MNTLAWNKDRLSMFRNGNIISGLNTYTFAYNVYGQRIRKVYQFTEGRQTQLDCITSRTVNYTYDHNGRLIGEKHTEEYKFSPSVYKELIYLYDEAGVVGFLFKKNGTESIYYYNRNIFGDVVGIYNGQGARIVKYSYDAWGNCTISEATDSEIATINPIRYRGYYYDKETNLYYLNSRYYSPEWRRFISPDDTSYLDLESVNGLNLYCYCNNDPVNRYDPTGHFGIWAIVGIVGTAMLLGGGAQLASNALAGETGSDLWRGVAGSTLGSGVNALALCLSPFTGGASLAFAAGLGAVVQTGVDTLETVIRGETVNGWQTVADLGINFVTTFAGDWLGAKLIPTNSGWFQPKKILSVFMKPYGQKILLQTAIGAGLSGTVNFVRKFDWSGVDWKKFLPVIPAPIVPMYPYF